MALQVQFSAYRMLSARMFDEAARRAGLSGSEMTRQLREELGRDSLSRQTLLAWRRGDQPVPMSAFLAACRIGQVKPPDVLQAVVEKAARFEYGDAGLGQLVRDLWWL